MESDAPQLRRRSAPHRWELWDNPTLLVVFLLTVELATVLMVAAVSPARVSTSEFIQFLALLLAGVVFEETSRRVAYLRLRVANLSYFDMSSVWTFAGALILPTELVAVLVILLRLHMWVRYQRRTRHHIYRHVYTATVIVLSCLVSGATARAVEQWLHPISTSVATAAAIGLAILMYRLTNTPLIAAAVALASPRTEWRSLLGTLDANALEFATLCLGIATAFIANRDALLLPIMLAPVIILQRAAMVKELTVAATIDYKTGLLNLPTWTHVGTTELNRAYRQNEPAALLMFDLDHFKQINSALGHLGGDETLRLVAGAITDELRDYDIIGRFGGEEFVALLPNTGEAAAREAAERVRASIKNLKMPIQKQPGTATFSLAVTISTGVACYPGHGDDLKSLLHAADAALYHAKNSGRDRVEFAPSHATTDDAKSGPTT